MATIGQTLRKLRDSDGLSGSTIAKAAGVSVGTYFKIEREQRDASFIVIFRICRFYELSLQEFADIVDPVELERAELSTFRILTKRKEKELNLP